MYPAIRSSTSRLFQKSLAILDAMSGIDDPQGDYLLSLETRVRHLEAELEQLKVRLEQQAPDGRRKE